MNILSTLTSIVQKPKRRVGRGFGSNKGGHTTGRGAKGDKARGTNRLTMDGTKIKKSWIQRLPRLRGKNKLHARTGIQTITLSQLSAWFKKGAIVDTKTLQKRTGRLSEFKIVSTGVLKHPVTLKGLSVSKLALEKINALGGKIEA